MSTEDQPAGPGGGTGAPAPAPVAVKALDEAFRYAEEARPPKARTERTLTVCPASEIPEGGRRIVEDGKISIGVFNIRGKFHAVRNFCPHQGAPLCVGKIYPTYRPSDPQEFAPTLEDRVLRCPWHGWEFDIVSGKGLFDRKTRVVTYEVRVDDEGNVVVML